MSHAGVPTNALSPQAAEASIPAINHYLAEVTAIGVTDFQIEGPVIYSRPAGVSSALTCAYRWDGEQGLDGGKLVWT